MLSQHDVCAQCGEQHPNTLFGLRHAANRGCPNVLMGAFPILTPQEPSRAASAVHRALGSDRTLSPTSSGLLVPPSAPHENRRPARLAIPWPMPMETDEFL